MEAKGSSPKRSSPWRVTNAKDRSQHSCTLRRRPLRPDTKITRRDEDDDTNDLPADSRPLTRLISAFTLAQHSQLNRWRNDGFDAFLHQTPIKPRRW